MADKCDHVVRVSIHPSIRIGGASIGRCENKCLPGMVRCYKHADREAMAFMIRSMAKALKTHKGGNDG